MCLAASVSMATREVNALPSILVGEAAESMCQNGALVEERAIPGAYSSGTLVIGQQAGGSGQTGKTVWNSGLLLARLLDELVDRSESSDFWSQQEILELGCGTSLGSIAAHRLGAKKVVATDGNPDVVELAKANIELNSVSEESSAGSIEAKPLQWGLLNAMDYSETASLVLGADLTYNAGSWRVLAETMATVIKLDGKGHVLYLSLGHEGFNVNAEMDGFLSVAKEVGLVATTELNGINISQLLQNSLTNAERKVLEQSGGARVVVLRPKFSTIKS
ncbi:MAG: hypothetical protein SGARI_005525 [Bacillariaceae sp.]